MPDVMFAYRYSLVWPERSSNSGQWLPNNTRDPPRPPLRWRGDSLPRDWHVWRTGKPGQRLKEQDVTPRSDITSLVWGQIDQRYWVLPEDCTRMTAKDGETEQDVQDRWQTLQCRHLKDPFRENEPSRPGLWQLVHYGPRQQHTSSCPPYFQEFLPSNFFTGSDPNTACHFVGRLSLILALMAMCPRDAVNIPTKIDDIFYQEDRPLFVPAHQHGDEPMNRNVLPTRGIVMQTAVIKHRSNSDERLLRKWEEGHQGSMVSSQNPTPAQDKVRCSYIYPVQAHHGVNNSVFPALAIPHEHIEDES